MVKHSRSTRLRAVKELEAGASIEDLAKEYQAAESTIRNWRSEFRPLIAALQRIDRDFIIGMSLALAILLVMIQLEHSAFGGRVAYLTYESVHSRLSQTESAVVIGDITDIAATLNESNQRVTSREALLDVIEALIAAGVQGIAVDVDLSPENGKPVLPTDPDFFERCLELSHGDRSHPGVPIYLGVNRTAAMGPEGWLGDARYAPLAVHMLIKDDYQIIVPTWIWPPGVEQPLWSMSTALARAHAGELSEPDRYPAFFATPAAESHEDTHRPGGATRSTHHPATSQMLVDCSGVEALDSHRVRTRTAAEVNANADRLRGKLVILGMADPEDARSNAFRIPGQSRPYPGTFVHASATNTILNGFVYSLTPTGRVIVDVALALLVFGTTWAIRRYARTHGDIEVHGHRLRNVLLLVGALLAFVAGYFWIARTRILWDGWIYIAIASLLHFYIEDWWLALRNAFRQIFVSRGGEA